MTTETATTALVGVDVGGSGVKAALVDLADGQATGRVRVETPQPATPDAITTTVAGLVRSEERRVGKEWRARGSARARKRETGAREGGAREGGGETGGRWWHG